MTHSMHALSVDVFAHSLANLAVLLRKGQTHAVAKKFEAEVLERARLAPDMFALVRQVQLTCDFAKNSTARLAGQEAPRFPDEEKTVDELLARVEKTLAYLRSVAASAFEGAATRDIHLPLHERALDMKGLPFLQRWALPNFFFHLVTTYDILRHNGVEVGKWDFLGSL
ncbi:MAG TPA: DUF1993 domain-containing protein [Steroidobacteraceae bacterium]